MGEGHVHLRPASPQGEPSHSRSLSGEGMGSFEQAFRLSPFRHSGLDAGGALYSPGGGESSPVAVPSPMAARATLAGRTSSPGPPGGSPPPGPSALGPIRANPGPPP